MEREDLKSIVESLLFVADGPVTLQRLEEVLEGASKEDIRSVLDELPRELDTQRRGVRLVEVAGGFQSGAANVHADLVKNFLGGRPASMSPPPLEALAIRDSRPRRPTTAAGCLRGRG